jgi:hypothetical protein
MVLYNISNTFLVVMTASAVHVAVRYFFFNR